MNKTTLVPIAVALAFVASSLSVWAIPSSSNDPFEYMIKGKDLSRFSVGLYVLQSERDINWDDSGSTQTLESDRIHAYLGYDIFNSMTIYAVGGASESKFGRVRPIHPNSCRARKGYFRTRRKSGSRRQSK